MGSLVLSLAFADAGTTSLGRSPSLCSRCRSLSAEAALEVEELNSCHKCWLSSRYLECFEGQKEKVSQFRYLLIFHLSGYVHPFAPKQMSHVGAECLE